MFSASSVQPARLPSGTKPFTWRKESRTVREVSGSAQVITLLLLQFKMFFLFLKLHIYFICSCHFFMYTTDSSNRLCKIDFFFGIDSHFLYQTLSFILTNSTCFAHMKDMKVCLEMCWNPLKRVTPTET